MHTNSGLENRHVGLIEIAYMALYFFDPNLWFKLSSSPNTMLFNASIRILQSSNCMSVCFFYECVRACVRERASDWMSLFRQHVLIILFASASIEFAQKHSRISSKVPGTLRSVALTAIDMACMERHLLACGVLLSEAMGTVEAFHSGQ